MGRVTVGEDLTKLISDRSPGYLKYLDADCSGK